MEWIIIYYYQKLNFLNLSYLENFNKLLSRINTWFISNNKISMREYIFNTLNNRVSVLKRKFIGYIMFWYYWKKVYYNEILLEIAYFITFFLFKEVYY